MSPDPRNGHVPDNELVVVEDNDRLYLPAANAFMRARAAWYAEGGSGQCIVENAGAYRSYAVQVDMRAHPERYHLNTGSKVGLAAPGYSNHGLGDCLDAAAGFQAFLLRRGHEFGLYRPFGDRDPNHWRYSPSLDQHATATLITRKKGSTDMSVLLYGPDTGTPAKPGAKVFVVASPGVWDRYSASFAKQLGSQFGSALELSLTNMLAKREQYLDAVAQPGGNAAVTITPADVEAIADAVVDEQHERLAD